MWFGLGIFVVKQLEDKSFILTVRHLRSVGACASGTRLFFKRHNLDYNDFLKNGIDSEKFLATGNAMALKIVKKVRQNV